jgi:lipopolysaccharide biosynthesis glycosyltransferase
MIDIVFITDRNYAIATAVACNSIVKNRKKDSKIRIHIMAVDLSEEFKSIILSISQEGVEIFIVDVQNDLEQFAHQHPHVSSAALIKFNLPKILKKLKRVLYLDSDVICQSDLSDLFHIPLDDYYAAVVKDMAATVDEEHHKKLGHNSYFNSGVMLLNLSKMRKDSISKKLIELKAKGTYKHFMDQDEINAVIGTHVVYVSPAYNLMERNFNHSLAKTANFYSAECSNFHNVLNAPVLRHLTNSPKVWCNPKDDDFDVWLDFLPATLFKDYIWFLDGQMDRRINQVELKVQSAQAQAQQLAKQLEQTQAGEQQAKAQLQQALEVVQSAQAQAQQLAHQLEQTQAGEQQAKAQLQQALEVVQSAQAQAQQLAHQLEQTQAGEQQAKAQLQQALEVVQSAQAQAQQLAKQLEQTQAGEQQAKAQINILTLELRDAKDENQINDQIINEQKIQLSQIQEELHRVHQSNYHFFLLSEQKQDQIEKIYNSTSWKITKPMRIIGSFINSSPKMNHTESTNKSLLTNSKKENFDKKLCQLIDAVKRRPFIKKIALRILNEMPKTLIRIRRIYIGNQSGSTLRDSTQLIDEPVNPLLNYQNISILKDPNLVNRINFENCSPLEIYINNREKI